MNLDLHMIRPPTLMGKLFYYLIPIRRKTILDNMRIVFGFNTPFSQLKRLAQCFYSHLAKSIAENLLLLWLSEDKLRDKIRVIGQEIVFTLAEKKRGVILMAGHFGNWEFAPLAFLLHFKKYQGRLHVIRRELLHKSVESILFRRFTRGGLHIIPKKNSLHQILDALSKNDAVIFIMDQHASPDSEGIWVEFFGKRAGTFKSLAMIARNTGAPVIPVVCYREKNGQHAVEFRPPLPYLTHEDPTKEIDINTRAYNEELEKMVLEHPDQWFWMHRRWKDR